MSCDPAAQTRQQSFTVRSPNGAVALVGSRKYQRYSWGEGLVESSVGDGADCRTTRRVYYETAAQAGFVPNGTRVPVKLIVPSQGPWTRYDAYDSRGRPLIVVWQFLNAPTNAPEAQCRSTHYDYTPLEGSGDDGSLPHIPRTTIQYLLGHEIARSYTIIKGAEQRHIRCQTPRAAWNAPDNLVTVKTFYTAGQFNSCPRTIDYSNGTREAFIHSQSGSGPNLTLTTVTLNGQPDPASPTNILSGTVTTTVTGHLGQLLSRTVQDKPSMIILSRETYQYTDEFFRSYTVMHLDGRTETHQYGCCGLEIETDPDGVQTQHLYDPMGRHIGHAILSFNPPLTTTNLLDAAGHVRILFRRWRLLVV
ncbi:MAG: hypothetical protein ACP5MD_12310 [Verrucomicrobiia bacterium]